MKFPQSSERVIWQLSGRIEPLVPVLTGGVGEVNSSLQHDYNPPGSSPT